MKEAVSVHLRSEIRETDINNLILWMENKNVTLYLNESSLAKEDLKHLLNSVPPHMFTYCFNQQGQFYLVCDSRDRSIGFLKMYPGKDSRYEVVYVIGEERLWGRGYGKAALRKALDTLFFDIRAKEVQAKICHGNLRSKNTALHCGLQPVRTERSTAVYAITSDMYMQRKKSPL